MTQDLVKILRLDAERETSIAGSVSKAIYRLHFLVGVEQKTLSAVFSENELTIVRDACLDGTWYPPEVISVGIQAFVTAVPDLTFEEGGVDKEALLAKIRTLRVTQSVALIEMFEDYWWEASRSKLNGEV